MIIEFSNYKVNVLMNINHESSCNLFVYKQIEYLMCC